MGTHYEYFYAAEELPEFLASIVSGIVSGFPMGMIHIAGYVLTGLALYTLAQRRGIRNGWLAWIPVFNCWLIGSLSDQYRYVARGEIRSKRKELLVLNIILFGLIIAMASCAIAAAVNLAMGFRGEMVGILIAVAAMALALSVVSIVNAVIYFIALSDLYRSMDPENGSLFLVLSILFNVTEPFFLFFNRKKDLGMPPRKDQAPPPEPEPYEYL